MNASNLPDRCRIVLVAPQAADPGRIAAALAGGDVASLILPQRALDDDAFQALASQIVPEAQARGTAVMIAGSPRVAARTNADGIHVEGSRQELADVVARYQSKMMVGAGGAQTRNEALELGEAQPDYLFFGRFDFDQRPEPHMRNLTLGRWWAEMTNIPCIVQAGAELVSLVDVATTGAEFVALSAAVFGGDGDPADAVAQANALLDEHAPVLEG